MKKVTDSQVRRSGAMRKFGLTPRAGKWRTDGRPPDKKDGGIRPSQAVSFQGGIVADNAN